MYNNFISHELPRRRRSCDVGEMDGWSSIHSEEEKEEEEDNEIKRTAAFQFFVAFSSSSIERKIQGNSRKENASLFTLCSSTFHFHF